MKIPIVRTLLAGLAGGLALNLAMILTFLLLGFGVNSNGILLDPSLQGAKVISVWTVLEPIPLVVASPAPIVIGLILFGIGHAFIYGWLSPNWPKGIIPRALRMGVLVFFFSFLFWEFFTPFNMYGEPAPLLGLELIFWAVIAFADAFAIAAVFEFRPAAKSQGEP
jgi:hypothetical protein